MSEGARWPPSCASLEGEDCLVETPSSCPLEDPTNYYIYDNIDARAEAHRERQM